MKLAISTALVASLTAVSIPVIAQAQSVPMRQPGQMMQNQNAESNRGMVPRMMGPMMRQMMGHMMGQRGMMHQGMVGSGFGFRREKPLSDKDIQKIIDGKLALSGFSRLKAGATENDGDDAAKVNIVSAKSELIFRLKVNRMTGFMTVVK